MLGAAGQAEAGGSDFVATIAEAVHNRISEFASAKLTPLEIAARLEAGAATLEMSAIEDFARLGATARGRAGSLRETYQAALWATGGAESAATRKFPASPSGAAPLTVALKLGATKALRAVGLHYRTRDPSGEPKTLELPATSEVNFQIPAEDLAGNWDVFYYFEILNADGTGWFEPDPFSATPYFTLPINAPRGGPNYPLYTPTPNSFPRSPPFI